MKILTGNSNKPLAEAISAKLALPLVKANIRRFSDNEIFVEILENVRGEDVFVIQSTSFPANDHLMELLITIDALRRSSARRAPAGSGIAAAPDANTPRNASTNATEFGSTIATRSPRPMPTARSAAAVAATRPASVR